MLLEDMNSKFDRMLEIVTPLAEMPQFLKDMGYKVEEGESEIEVMKVVVKDHSAELRNHGDRIIKLEDGVTRAL